MLSRSPPSPQVRACIHQGAREADRAPRPSRSQPRATVPMSSPPIGPFPQLAPPPVGRLIAWNTRDPAKYTQLINRRRRRACRIRGWRRTEGWKQTRADNNDTDIDKDESKTTRAPAPAAAAAVAAAGAVAMWIRYYYYVTSLESLV